MDERQLGIDVFLGVRLAVAYWFKAIKFSLPFQ